MSAKKAETAAGGRVEESGTAIGERRADCRALSLMGGIASAKKIDGFL